MGEPMIIDAVGEDGKSVLSFLNVSGRLVRSTPTPHTVLLPGMILRANGGWAVVLTVTHRGVQGYSEIEHLGDGSPVARRSIFMDRDQPVKVRVDVMIDPRSLYKLVMAPENQRCAYCRSAEGPFDKINTAGNLACRNVKLCQIRQTVQRGPALVCDDCYKLATGLLAECQDGCARTLDHPGVCLNSSSDGSACVGCAATDERLTVIEQGDLAA